MNRLKRCGLPLKPISAYKKETGAYRSPCQQRP
jgi:hypothetical protein